MTEATPSQLIDGRIQELGDWRGETLARVRKLIHEADPEVGEAVTIVTEDSALRMSGSARL